MRSTKYGENLVLIVVLFLESKGSFMTSPGFSCSRYSSFFFSHLVFFSFQFLPSFSAPDRLDVTVTTTLINMINHTMASWSEDYYRPDPSPVSAVAASGTPSLPSVSSSMSGSRHDSLNRSMSTDSPLSSPTSRPESSASLWSSGSGFPRRRSPFVPFLLRNQTGVFCGNE